jgi:CheY-like chemotaxis protein
MARILLVDDNPELLEVQRTVLRHVGHEVVTAGYGKEAFRMAEHSTFCLLITDIIMPEVDGLDLILALRHRQPRLKIIAITGGGRMEPAGYLDIAKKLGAARTLAKPVTGGQLLSAVASVLGGKE